MNVTIFKVLQALNRLEVHGEENLNLLLFAIQQLKPLQIKSNPTATQEIDCTSDRRVSHADCN